MGEAETLLRTGRVHGVQERGKFRVDPADPYDDKDPWGVPDRWQCPFEDGEGHRCVLGEQHTGDHLPKTCKEA